MRYRFEIWAPGRQKLETIVHQRWTKRSTNIEWLFNKLIKEWAWSWKGYECRCYVRKGRLLEWVATSKIGCGFDDYNFEYLWECGLGQQLREQGICIFPNNINIKDTAPVHFLKTRRDILQKLILENIIKNDQY